MTLNHVGNISIVILSLITLPISTWAQEDVLPRPFEVYGGSIGTIDAIQVPGETNKTRIFASTDSANSVFYVDVDHSSVTPFGTNFMFHVIPDMDANANFGAPNWLAAHQQSGRILVGTSSGLVSCTISSGSLITPITDPISFVLIQGSQLFAVNDPGMPETPKTLYYGSLDSSGNLTPGSALGTNFYASSVQLAVSPANQKVYVLCARQTNFTLLKSDDNYDAFNSGTVFSEIPSAGVTISSVGQLAVAPDGRLFLGGYSGGTLEVAWSDSDGAAWTNVNTGGNMAGVGRGLNIVCNGSSNAYEVYFGTAVSSNKGVAGSWYQMRANAGSTKVDPVNAQVVYLTTDKGFGGSTNAGIDTMELNNGLLAFQINDIDALASKSVAWIGSKAGLRIATNFNTSPVWADANYPNAIVSSVAIDSTDLSGMTGYAGGAGLYKTTTGGGTNMSFWVQVFSRDAYGLPDGAIRSVKAKGSFVALGYYSGTQNNPSGGVWASSNGGSNWTAVITNIDVNKLLRREEGGIDIVYVAVSKGKSGDRGGIYRIESSSVVMDMTNEVNIRDLAEDSVGGIYASGSLPNTFDPGRHDVVAYYRSTDSVWSPLPTNGLPGGLWDGYVLGSDNGPVITVGKDSASNDVPVLAILRTIYYLPYGGSSWVAVTNYPNGTQIKTLFWDDLMVGTTIGLYSQGLNAEPETATLTPLTSDFDGDGKADPALYVESTGLWHVKLSTMNYTLVTINFGGTGYQAVNGDFDGDGKADPAVYQASTGNWQVKLSAFDYAMATVTGFGDSNYDPIAADYDGDRKIDPAVYERTTGYWKVMLSGNGYGIVTLTGFGGTGYTAIHGDFDGDHLADVAIYGSANGDWKVMLSASSYITATLSGFGGTGYFPIAADFDGDGLTDPAIYETATGNWSVKLSGNSYATTTLTGFGGTGYSASVADYDGDGKTDPILFETATGLWRVKLSAMGYAEVTMSSGYTPREQSARCSPEREAPRDVGG